MSTKSGSQVRRTAEQWAAINAAKVAHECSPVHIQHLLQDALDEIVKLGAALTQCAEWFQQYADGHAAKGDADKAQRNQDRADAARAALGRDA